MVKIEFKLDSGLTVIKGGGHKHIYYTAYLRKPKFKLLLRTTDRQKIDAVIARYR